MENSEANLEAFREEWMNCLFESLSAASWSSEFELLWGVPNDRLALVRIPSAALFNIPEARPIEACTRDGKS